MSEVVKTVISIVNALTSPKTSIKYLTIGLCLGISSIFVTPRLSEIGVSEEYLVVIILFTSVGLGSLIGTLIGVFYDFLLNKHKDKQKIKQENDKLEAEKSKEIQLASIKNEAIVKDIQTSIEYLNSTEISLLFSLLEGEKKLSIEEFFNSTSYKKQYIYIVAEVGEQNFLVRLNPVVENVVKAKKHCVQRQIVQQFFERYKHAREILDLLDVKNSESTDQVNDDILEEIHQYTLPINCKLVSESYSVGFADSFYHEAFNMFTDKEYVRKTIIPSSRIIY